MAILRELLGLFVDDGSLALALILWVAICGFGLSHAPVPESWDAPILFIGCLIILVFNVMRSARGKGK